MKNLYYFCRAMVLGCGAAALLSLVIIGVLSVFGIK